jgi:hypothetical protein
VRHGFSLTWVVDVQVLGSSGRDGGCPHRQWFEGLDKLHGGQYWEVVWLIRLYEMFEKSNWIRLPPASKNEVKQVVVSVIIRVGRLGVTRGSSRRPG